MTCAVEPVREGRNGSSNFCINHERVTFHCFLTMHLCRSFVLLSTLAPAAALIPGGASRSLFAAPKKGISYPRQPLATGGFPRVQPMRMLGGIMDLLGGGGGGGLIEPEKALPGRQQKQPNISSTRHYVLGGDLEKVPEGHKVAVFANGCFWGSEKGIWRLPQGIYSTTVGYCAGFTPNPTYEEACSGQTGHTEGVRVVYDPSKVSFVDILRWFWEAHDPCSGMGQGNDRGSQYRSGFYYFDEEQKALIEASKAAYENQLGKPITTEIAAASDYDKYGGLWYFGELYHQQYLAKPGARPYCSAQPQGVSLADFDTWAPAELKEKHAPTLPESFWAKHAPRRGCSVIKEPNDPIEVGSY